MYKRTVQQTLASKHYLQTVQFPEDGNRPMVHKQRGIKDHVNKKNNSNFEASMRVDLLTLALP